MSMPSTSARPDRGMAVDGSRPSIDRPSTLLPDPIADDAEDLAPADLQRHPSQGRTSSPLRRT